MSSVDGVSSKQDDFWDQPFNTRANRPVTLLRKKADPVKDDWDDEEEEEEVEDETLWREANTKAPMPEVILAWPSTTSTAGTVVPPTEAFQTPIRILKRPKPSTSASQSSVGSAASAQKSLEDREAAYQAARERIFGSKTSDSVPCSGPGTPSDEKVAELSASLSKLDLSVQGGQGQNKEKNRSSASARSMSSESVGKSSPTEQQQQTVSVIRNPRGPASSGGSGSSSSAPSRGFGGKRGAKRGSVSGSKEASTSAQNQDNPARIPGIFDPTSTQANLEDIEQT